MEALGLDRELAATLVNLGVAHCAVQDWESAGAFLEAATDLNAEQDTERLGLAGRRGRTIRGRRPAVGSCPGAGGAGGDLVHADEAHSAQPGTAAWIGFTTTPAPAPGTGTEVTS